MRKDIKIFKFFKYFFACIAVFGLFTVYVPCAYAENEKEIKVGIETAKSIEKEYPRVQDPTIQARTDMILDRLRIYTQRDLPYEMRLIEMKYPNAFALPGGICYVTTALIDFVKSDSELAAIMAHELVHADKGHGLTQAARNERLTILAIALAIATKGHGAAMMMTSIAQVAILNAYSRDLEREADAGAAKILLRAGYDPNGMLTIFERLSEEELKRPWVDPGVYQSHPSMKERLAFIEDSLKANKITPSRKGVLGLLATEIITSGDKLSLNIDKTPVLTFEDDEDKKALAVRIKSSLDEYLNMETPPYDIQITNNTLRISGRVLATSSQINNLEELRANLIGAIQSAQRKHPMGRYLKY